MAQDKEKIGLLLASIHTGISQNVWASFADTAATENTTLFIFPGGRLNARQDFEYLRNQVYLLANTENLDGCISWSSSIRYNQSTDEFEHFHTGLDPLPYVTLAFKMPGHPCVEFDSYNGMKALVTHCIERHGARNIAFLRGPDFHLSAQARYQGYCDSLKEAGLGVNATLITGPFDWGEGEAAAAQLFEERSLVPGRDFDTLAGSSDMMALGAVDYYARKGYHVPDNYHAVGFNNSAESRIAESPFSTVHLPYTEMSVKSFKILLGNMRRTKNRFNADVLLNSEVIIRKSCGCTDHYQPPEPMRGNPDAGRAEETLVKAIRDYLKPDPAAMNAVVMPAIHALLRGERGQFFPLFEKALVQFFGTGKDPENLLQLFDHLCSGSAAPDFPENIRRLEPAIYRSMFKVRERLDIRARYEKERWNTALNSLKCDLLGTRDRFSLIQSLARHLPKIGITTAAIVLYHDEKNSVFAGGFSAEGISPVRELHFPARLLVPAGLKTQYANGVFMVQPLFIENRSLGYFVHNVPIRDGVIFEELRSSISYALKGIFLHEEAISARYMAEQAEQAKTEFTQVLENGMYDLCQGVKDRLEFMEAKIASGGERVINDLQNLKSFVNAKEAEAGSILDFTLARIENLSLRKTLFDPEDLLPGIGSFPLLLGDTERLAQCFSLIREHYPAEFSAELTYGGLSVTFRGTAMRKKSLKAQEKKGRQFGLLFAERVIRMHKGDFSTGADYCTVTLPWTTLTGQEVSGNPAGSRDHILVLSDPVSLPANFFTLPPVRDIRDSLQDRTAFIVWNAAGASPEDMVKVASLRRKNTLTGIPFLCYGMPAGSGGVLSSAASIMDAVEFALKSPKKGAVLFIGSYEYWSGNQQYFLPKKETRLKKIRIDSMADFDETVSEINPLLIVFGSLDIAGAAAVRRHPLTIMVPILMIDYRIDNKADVTALSQYSRLMICHHAVIASAEFQARIQALIKGDDILPPHTGVLVKKAVLYFGQYAETRISRWKLASSVNVSEDYLTRIFHREMGLSLWDYLNRYRIFLAAELLRQTDDTIQDIAYKTGFQDQTYFCRVFKKIYGLPPGQLRKQ